MGNVEEGTESKEWQAVNVEEGTYVSPSRMFAIQSGTEADMAATKNTLEKSMRMGHPSMWWDPMGDRFLFLTFKKTKQSSRTISQFFTQNFANTPTTTVDQSHSFAKGTGKAKTCSAPDEERSSGKQPRHTPTSSTPAKRTAKPSAPGSEKKRKTDHRNLALKHVWELNAAKQVRNAIETTAEWSWANTKQFFEKLDARMHEEEQAQDDFSRDFRMQRRRDQREGRRGSGCSDRQIREGVRANH